MLMYLKKTDLILLSVDKSDWDYNFPYADASFTQASW